MKTIDKQHRIRSASNAGIRKAEDLKVFLPMLTLLLLSLLLFLFPSAIFAGPIPDTGQTKCYDNTGEIPCPAPGGAFYGQDGNYTINPPSYTKLDASGNALPDNATSWAMIRDNVTGLIWENKTDDGGIHDKDNTYTWYDSNPATNGGNAGTPGDGTDTEDFIAALNAANFGGHSDWRLPTLEELRQIADVGRKNPAISTAYFSNTVASYYWSSSTNAFDTSTAWDSTFTLGFSNSSMKSYSYHVRAVRGRNSLNQFLINNDGTVTDAATGLMWQQDTAAGYYRWEQAILYCEGLTLAGYSDWRLPNIKELASIVDLSRYNPSINTTYFHDTQGALYWSSNHESSLDAWSINYYYGKDNFSNKVSVYNYVRAVRGGQSQSLGSLVISAPEQAARWEIGQQKLIAWDTAGISGNVKITLSRQGGKTGTFTETIAESVPNSGSYPWIVTGIGSANCVIKIEPIDDPSKGTSQGLFSIKDPLDNWALRNSTTPQSLCSIAYGSGIFLAVGTDGVILTSSDGVFWTKGLKASDNQLLSVAYGNNVFAVTGDSSIANATPQGVSWSLRAAPWWSVAYGNGVFVAAGGTGYVSTSTDGLVWTNRNSGTTQNLRRVSFCGTRFIAVGDSGVIVTSPDGITWTRPDAVTSDYLFGAAYGNGTYVAVGDNGTVLTSPDGILWTKQQSPTVFRLQGVIFQAGRFVTYGGSGVVLFSSDGIVWHSPTQITNQNLGDAAFGADTFVVVGPVIIQSADMTGQMRYGATVSKTGTGQGSVTNVPLGIDCGLICSKSFNDGTEINLTATPEPDSEFVSWSGACQGSQNPCSFILDSSKTVTAEFKIKDSVPPSGTVEINGGEPATNNTNVILTISATDTNGVAEMQLSNDGSTWLEPVSFAGEYNWMLTAGDGEKTVYVRFKDTLGYWSGVFSDTIILDVVLPTVTASLSGGTYIGSQTVALSASEGATIYYTLDGSNPTTSSLVYTNPINMRVTTTLKYFVRDSAGNESAVQTAYFTITPPEVQGMPIPDTGQTKCYDNTGEITCPQPGAAFYGQDGNYTINPQSYTKLGASGEVLPDDATSWALVRDNVTGLIWENKTDDGSIHDKDNTYTWYDSNPATNGGYAGTPGDGTDTEDFIAALNAANFGGYSDWRMPTVKELTAIVNRGRYNPSIDTTFFPGTASSYYWSSTTVANNNVRVWCVNYSFYGGYVDDYNKTYAYSMRAVRGGQVRGGYIDNGDGTVTDTKTGLMWQQETMGGKNWEAALDYADSLDLAGYDDWRLPNINKLQSIVDYSRIEPSIDTTLFPGTVSSSYYWSSNTGAPAGGYDSAWCVGFSDGDVCASSKTTASSVRTVRGGQFRILGSLFISAPEQATRWNIGEQKLIAWDTAGISGNVKITLSRQGGKTGTFTEIIADSIPNNGSFAWTVAGPETFNAALKIEPLSDPTKGTTQGLFSICNLHGAFIIATNQGDPGHYKLAFNGQYTDGVISINATFTSSDTTVATIDQYGFLTALKNGYVEVSTFYNDVTYKKGLFVYNTAEALEIESNNTKATANTLAENQFRRAKSNPSLDVDFFKITLTTPSLLNIGFLSQSSTADVKVELFSAADTLLASGTSTNGQPLMFPLGLYTGDYYLKTSQTGDIDDTNYYIVTYKIIDALPGETVIPIAIGETKSGTVNTLNDTADFTFTLAQEQAIRIGFDPTSDQAKYRITLLDVSQNVVDQIDALSQIPVYLEAIYGAGSYTLRVTPVDVVDALNPFTVQLAASTSQMENEPNDTSAQATAWNTAQTVSGRLMSTMDGDFYGFTLAEARNVDITFSCAGSSGNFFLTLYKDSDQNQIDGIDIVGGQTTTLSVGLRPGTYYLKIDGDGANTDTIHNYTLNMTDSALTGLATEPDNMIASANPLENNVVRKGRIFNAGDKDHYGFYLTTEALFTVTFTPTTTTGDYKVSVLDVHGNVLDYFTSTDGQIKTTEVYQIPGNFYVLVEANGNIDQFSFYDIKVTSTAAITVPRTYTITSDAVTGGMISPLGAVGVLLGMHQSFIIDPASGYEIANVIANGNPIGKVGSYTFENVTANHTISAQFIGITSVSPKAGIYGSTQNVALTNNGQVTIYYTIDGTTPNTSSPQYFLPIPITQTTTLKFFAVDGLGNQEAVKTARYTIITNGWLSIAAGGYHSLGIKSDGTLWAWGNNYYGQLGDGTTTNRYYPVQVDSENTWVAVSCGSNHSLGIKSNGTLWAWGKNEYGQLGDGTTTNRYYPVQVDSENTWVAVSCGNNHSLGIKSDGTLWAWGNNDHGKLGDGTIANRTSPIQIGTDSAWVAVSAGGSHSLSLKSDGTIWAWGLNDSGQLGDGTTIDKASPVQIGTNNLWVTIEAGTAHSLSIKSDGTLWAWGNNTHGQLGDGSQTNRFSPIMIGTENTWFVVIGGGGYSLGLKSDETLWGWGWNCSGQLGDGSRTNRAFPGQISTYSNWVKVSGGDFSANFHSLGIKSDGTLWAWGENHFGKLGDGTTTERLIPTQIGGPVYASNIVVSPSTKEFGSIEIGQTSSTETFTITNTGNVDLIISSITIAGSDSSMFTLSNGTCPNLAPTLAPGASCTVTTSFSPTSTGLKQATLQIVSNDPGEPTLNIVLSGTGFAQDFSITSNDIKVVQGESAQATLTLTAYNNFSSTVNLSYEFIGNTLAGTTVTLTPDSLIPLVSGSSVTMQVATSGTTQNGIYTIRVMGTGGGITKTKDIQVMVNPPLSVQTTALGAGAKGQAYAVSIPVSGGIAPYTFEKIAGEFPAGLSFNANTGALTGTPTSRGIYTFTIRVTDSAGHTASKEYSIRVYDPAYRKLILEYPSWILEKGTLSNWITARVIDDYGQAVNVTSSTMIGIVSSSAATRFTLDGSGFTSDNTISPSIPMNFSSAMFKCKDTDANAFALTVHGVPGTPSETWESSTYPFTVTLPELENATLTIDSLSQNAVYGQGVPVTGTLKNSQTNVPLPYKNVKLVFTAPSSAQSPEQTVQTTSNGIFTYTAGTSVIDTAGTWSVQATFRDTEPAEYNETTASASFNVAKADTRIILNVSTGSTTPNGQVTVSGQLSSYTAVPVNLSGIGITVDFIEPDGTTLHSATVVTYDEYGHFTYTNPGPFNTLGLWSIRARMTGTANLNSSISDVKSLIVATAPGYAILIQGDSGGQYRNNYAASLDDIYKKLIKRSFTDDMIYYLSYSGAIHDAGVTVDAFTTRENIQNAITVWAAQKIAQGGIAPLYIIIMDHGSPGIFHLDPESMTPDDLNGWVTTLETTIKTNLGQDLTTIIVNGSCYSGSFIPKLSKQRRVVITSSAGDEESAQGPVSNSTIYGEYFVYYLFNNLAAGDNLQDAFREAAKVTHHIRRCSGFGCGTNSLSGQGNTRQHPLLDDNGDGEGSWMNLVGQEDGSLTKNLILGMGANPVNVYITETMPTAKLPAGTTGLTAWAKTSDPARTVASWVEVRKPSYVAPDSGGTGQVVMNLPRIDGTYSTVNGRWEYPLSSLTEAGTYTLYYYILDDNGDVQPPVAGTFYINTAGNQTPSAFNLIDPASGEEINDAMMVFNWENAADPDSDPVSYTIRFYEDAGGVRGNAIKSYELIPQTFYYMNAAREKRADGITSLFATGNYYWWEVEAIDDKGAATISSSRRFHVIFTNALTGVITGILYSDLDYSRITTASLIASIGGVNYNIPVTNGTFVLSANPGDVAITGSAAGFQSIVVSDINVLNGEITTLNIGMTSTAVKGDIDGLNGVTLSDAILALKVVSGLSPGIRENYSSSGADVNGDGKVGMAEVNYILQKVAGLR